MIVIEISWVQTSCGFAPPRYDDVGQRDTLLRWADAKGDARIETYHRERNARGIDGRVTPPGKNR